MGLADKPEKMDEQVESEHVLGFKQISLIAHHVDISTNLASSRTQPLDLCYRTYTPSLTQNLNWCLVDITMLMVSHSR